MFQQSALILIAGLTFLFFFTPEHQAEYSSGIGINLLLMAIITFIPALLSYVIGKRAIKQLPDERSQRIRLLRNSRFYAFIFSLFVLAGFIFQVYYLKLPLLIDHIFSFLKLRNLRTMIGIIPLIIALLLTRISIYELEKQVKKTSWKRREFLALNLKLMLIPLIPFGLYLLVGDIIEQSPLSVRIFFITRPYFYWIIIISIISIIYIKAPSLIKRIWPSQSLPDGPLRQRIEYIAQKENIKYKDILVWNTAGGRIANAAMAGLLPYARYIFLTDHLLNNFTIDEIETVAAHEMGHIKYKHALSYLIFSFGYLTFYIFLYIHIFPFIQRLNLGTTYIGFLGAAATLTGFYLYFVFIFRFLSRRFERQADLYAVDVTGKPDTFKSALMRLAAVNYIPRKTPRIFDVIKTHPSILRRLEFIDKGMNELSSVVRYKKAMLHMKYTLAIIFLAVLTLFITSKESLFPPAEIHYEIGRQYAIEGMIDEAIVEFSNAIKLDPESEMAHYALGVLYAQKGSLDQAVEELEKALEINPGNKAIQRKLIQVKKRSEA
ncbi:M48 family metalloprotease [Candidatus Poribacteria bacterium]|nr:M48 family metalloprotease [Candidatus Poribacteria bacterium]